MASANPSLAPPQPPSQNDIYMIHRDFRSSIRLNYNHFLMREFGGYLIHHRIPLASPDTNNPLRIADVATGSAVWAVDVCTQLPSASVHGFDISTAQFPPPSQQPRNLILHIHDAFRPFPPSLHGTFDIVHVRFVLCFTTETTAPALLANLTTLLKPGGHLQWWEPLVLSVFAAPPPDQEPPVPTPAIDRLVSLWHSPTDGSSFTWIEELPKLYAAVGLEVVAADRIPTPERFRYTYMLSQLAGVEDGWAKARVPGEDDLKKWMAELLGEFRTGAYADTRFFCVVGKKGV